MKSRIFLTALAAAALSTTAFAGPPGTATSQERSTARASAPQMMTDAEMENITAGAHDIDVNTRGRGQVYTYGPFGSDVADYSACFGLDQGGGYSAYSYYCES